MHLTHALGIGRRPRAVHDTSRRHPHRAAAAAPRPARRRRHEGPQDVALYTCACGFAWSGRVTTSVACPHCGTAQAW
jgi:rubrerythrin